MLAAATFGVVPAATVAEGSALMVCVKMSSAGATLSKKVVVEVSAVEDSGMKACLLLSLRPFKPFTFRKVLYVQSFTTVSLLCSYC